MIRPVVYLCPVCRRAIRPTMRGNIPGHVDALRLDTCPASGEPFRIALDVTPEYQGVSA